VTAREGMAECHMQNGDFQEALKELRAVEQSVEMNDIRARILYKMGLCMEKVGETAGARKLFSQIMSDYPHTWVAYEAELAITHIPPEE
jgi:TolA-binding protein